MRPCCAGWKGRLSQLRQQSCQVNPQARRLTTFWTGRPSNTPEARSVVWDRLRQCDACREPLLPARCGSLSRHGSQRNSALPYALPR